MACVNYAGIFLFTVKGKSDTLIEQLRLIRYKIQRDENKETCYVLDSVESSFSFFHIDCIS